MGQTGKYIIDHEFYCTKCGRKGLPVCRNGRMRETGHLKKLFCLGCGCETNHAECIPGTKYDKDVFFQEYNDGNFNEDGLRILSLSAWKAKNNIEESSIEEEMSIDEWMTIFQMKA